MTLMRAVTPSRAAVPSLTVTDKVPALCCLVVLGEVAMAHAAFVLVAGVSEVPVNGLIVDAVSIYA